MSARRRRAGAAAIAVLAIGGVVVPTAAAAGTATVAPTSTTVVEVDDWALGSPTGAWDFEDPSIGWPLSPSESPPSLFDAWPRPTTGGVQMPGRRTIHLLYAQSGAALSDRNASRRIDGTRWDRLSTRIWVDRPAFLFVQAKQCDMSLALEPRDACTTENVSTGKPLAAGWNLVVDHELFGTAWDHAVDGVQIRVCPMVGVSCSTDPSSPMSSEVAWVRLADEAAPEVGLTVSGGSATRLGWERITTNVRSADAGEQDVDGTDLAFPVGLLEPGAYRFRVDDGGGWGPWSAAVTVRRRPRPVVLDPDATGEAADWASAVRSNPWDLASSADVERLDGIYAASYGGGWLRGTSTASDPRVTLRTDGQTINTRRWHRLSVEVDNPGPWHLTGTSGVLGRLLWWPASAPTGAAPVTGDDIIIPGGAAWVHVDLATTPSVRIEEEGGPGIGWTELGEVRTVRWDPHEVDDTRDFGLGHLRLGRNDQVDDADTFTIRWRDDGWRPGTTAEVSLVDAADLHDGTVIGTVPMTSATGQLVWTNPGGVAGTRWVRIALTDVDGNESVAFSTGPLDVTQRATFTDVGVASPFLADVDWLVGEGLADDDPDRYRPGAVTSRQAMAAFLYRLAGAPDGAEPPCPAAPFPDVATSHPFCGEIAWLADEGLATGYADGGFHPGAGISRQAMAAMLLRFAGMQGHVVPNPPTCAAAPFPDVAPSHPFCGEIAWLTDEGIAAGYADGGFHPGDPITRQAMAAFVHRAADADLT